MGAQKIAHCAICAPPNLLKETCYGLTIGLVAGGFWKIHHWDYKRRTKEFHEMLERGEISVVVDEE